MIWDVILGLAVAYLAALIIWRLTAGRLSQPVSTGGPAPSGLATRLFGRGWLRPAIALIVIVVVAAVRFGPQIMGGIEWTEAEHAELEHFVEATNLYGEASGLSSSRTLHASDWESVNALLQASLSEAEQVSDSVLMRLDPELKTMFREKFMPGLRLGAYSLRYYAASPQKGSDTIEHHRTDSLNAGRQLLEEWNAWWVDHRNTIQNKLN